MNKLVAGLMVAVMVTTAGATQEAQASTNGKYTVESIKTYKSGFRTYVQLSKLNTPKNPTASQLRADKKVTDQVNFVLKQLVVSQVAKEGKSGEREIKQRVQWGKNTSTKVVVRHQYRMSTKEAKGAKSKRFNLKYRDYTITRKTGAVSVGKLVTVK